MNEDAYDPCVSLEQYNARLRGQGLQLKKGKQSVAVYNEDGDFLFRCASLKKAVIAIATHYPEVSLTA